MPFRLGLGFGVKVRVSFKVGGNQRIVPEENCPLVSFGVGNNFPPGQLSQNRYFVIVKNSVETFSCSGSAVGSCSGSWCSRSYSGSAVAV